MTSNRCNLKNNVKKSKNKKKMGSKSKPRVSIFRSIKHIYIQAINDYTGYTISSISSNSKIIKEKGYNKNDISFILGKHIGELLLKKGVENVYFDRNGFKYIGKISDVAEGIRKTGIYL